MYRKEKIYQVLIQQVEKINKKDLMHGYNGVSTSELASKLSMDRANCSKELNQLCKEKKVVKVEGRPVRYFPVVKLQRLFQMNISQYEVDNLKIFSKTIHKDSFDSIVGSQGSLKLSIDKAKAAMIYPPNGLHTIVSGETGVGKTMFAKLMYQFAKNNGILNSEAPFISFNCSEYKDNPQLLLSTLFGYKKGAFTGADNDKSGLVEKADNGILFLDEIHRLPAEGQEMLFHLIDAGQYRQMGDSEHYYNARVLIIAATTEPLESVMLSTFLRRIPMVIDLPTIGERGVDERFELISMFFNGEFQKVCKKIHVQTSVLKSLLGYRCVGNVGQLKADINLICARAYLEAINNEEEIYVSKKFLPAYVLDGILSAEKNKDINFLLDKFSEEILFDGTEVTQSIFRNEDWYTSVTKGETLSAIRKELETSILTNYPASKYNRSENEEIFKVIEPSVYYEVNTALKIAEKDLNKTFSKRIYVAFAMHVNALLHPMGQNDLGNLDIGELRKLHPNELRAAETMRRHIEQELRVIFDPREVYLFALFLMMDEDTHDRKLVGLIILAHGNGIAKNIAKVANSLLDSNHAQALDMPLEKNVDEFYEEFEVLAQQVDQKKGILIMTDMGSLNSFGELLTEKTGIPTKTIDMISTPYVLEALRKTLISTYQLEEIYNDIKTEMFSYLTKDNNIAKTKLNQQGIIITTCMTGKGAAVALNNFLKNSLPIIDQYKIDLIAMNKEEFKIKEFSDKKILAVVGSHDLAISTVPYISSEKVLLGNGLEELIGYIKNEYKESGGEKNFPSDQLIGLQRILDDTLTFLNPHKTLEFVIQSFEIINSLLTIENYNHYLVTYVLHVSAMLERVIKNENFAYPDLDQMTRKHKQLYELTREAMGLLENVFVIQIPDTEVGYVMDIFNTE